jgi:hypothetical protein
VAFDEETIQFASLLSGECSAEELERLMTIVANPRQYKIPDWFLNRQKDHKTGKFAQVCWLHVMPACSAVLLA